MLICMSMKPNQKRRKGNIFLFSAMSYHHRSFGHHVGPSEQPVLIILLLVIMAELPLLSWVECGCMRAVSCSQCVDTGGSCIITIRPRGHPMDNLLISFFFRWLLYSAAFLFVLYSLTCLFSLTHTFKEFPVLIQLSHMRVCETICVGSKTWCSMSTWLHVCARVFIISAHVCATQSEGGFGTERESSASHYLHGPLLFLSHMACMGRYSHLWENAHTHAQAPLMLQF